MNKSNNYNTLIEIIKKESFNKEYKSLLNSATSKFDEAYKEGIAQAEKQFIDDLTLLIEKGANPLEAIKELQINFLNKVNTTNIHK